MPPLRLLLTGPESTGKTLLAHRLAAMDKKLSEVADDTPERTADLVAFHNKLYGEWNI